MTEKETLEQDIQDEAYAKVVAGGVEAQALIQHPLIDGFFRQQFHLTYQAFEDLPYGATLEQYQEVHHHFKALKELRQRLSEHITAAKMATMEKKNVDAIPDGVDV